MSQTDRRWRSVLKPGDVVRVGLYGLRGRTGRSILTALGVTIGIASIVAVLGISASSRADILAQIDALGTDLLVVEAGSTFLGAEAELPVEAPAMVRRIQPVTAASSVSRIQAEVERNRYTDDRNGIDVISAEPSLIDILDASLSAGRFIDDTTSGLPVVMLGSVAAERLGIDSLDGSPTVWIVGVEFTVIGILDSHPLHPDMDRTVIIGNQAAAEYLGVEVVPTRIYLRADPDHVEAVREVLGRTVNPASPNEVDVSRPSDALEAKARVDAVRPVG